MLNVSLLLHFSVGTLSLARCRSSSLVGPGLSVHTDHAETGANATITTEQSSGFIKNNVDTALQQAPLSRKRLATVH